MASKKGIAITAAIAAAVVGSSFLIWLLPQSSPGGNAFMTPPTDSEIISDVYARHNDIAFGIEIGFEKWKKDEISAQDFLGQISAARVEVQNLQNRIESATPSPKWNQSFVLYGQALATFSEYLDAIETVTQQGEKVVSDSRIEELDMKWRDYVDESVAAVPIEG